jgi:hypothetical protein
MPEGDGSVLDNTVICWVNELGIGNTHTRNDIPFMLAGGCQGALTMGRHLTYDNEPHGKLLVSLAQAMDVNIDTFGLAEHSQGPLDKLTG